MTTGPVRVRLAPSPTGTPHLGTVRTAIFDWLLARNTGGVFILRIEDTDRNRYVPESLGEIYESLRWLGLQWDEGPEVGGPHAPYFQSERLDLYQAAARKLIEGGHAYECYCTPERLDAMRNQQRAQKLPPGYDGLCSTNEGRMQAKAEAGGRTVSSAVVLDDAARVVELSRMLSGQPESAAARGHAEELLDVARRRR